MKCHSDFVPGKRYDCAKYAFKGYMCVGHRSDGVAVLETPGKALMVVQHPSNWQPGKQTYVRYVTMYSDGPGIYLYKDKEGVLKDKAKDQGILGAAKVIIEWDENSDE